MKAGFIVQDWGLVDYKEAFERQKQGVSDVMNGGRDLLILCEHPPVLTLGRMSTQESLLYSRQEIQKRGLDIIEVDRGGDVTLHAPGQLIIYPLFNLNNHGKDLKLFMENLEEVAVDLLKNFGILAISIPGKRGVFAGSQKIVSIGVGVRKWVTYHGLGINANTDLSLFNLIKPCGLDVRMTSIKEVLKKPVDMDALKIEAVGQFKKHFSYD
ncbi:MAG: lipoyl(octanoyl) transferase LipB [Candidatus Omnitrophica bacterium]|nr:lipoyl(octanoyl) transferase LipB [Candidatus Omnitrophota bacterium]